MNLDNVELGKPKQITGVHLYSAIKNEAGHVTDDLDVADQEGAKKPLRAVHLWQRELSRVIGDFDAAKIHFQGTRLHALVYRPVGKDEEMALRAVALAHAVRLTTEEFNDALGGEAGFELAAGAAFGDTLATRSGSRGDSELLFLGDAANHGAKAIDKLENLRVTRTLADLLDDAGVDGLTVTDLGSDYFRVAMTEAAVDAVVERFGLSWSRNASRSRIDGDWNNTTLDNVGVSKATTDIDKDVLSLANSKLNHATSLFGDVDGFTATVEAATTDDEKARLVRRFHHIRSELRHVCTQDFSTLRVQYQGDRIQSVRHLPHDDEVTRTLEAVKLAAAWQSTMEDVLPAVLGPFEGARLAVALATGPTAVSKLGERGNRDLICLGKPVRRAAKIEAKLDGNEIGITEGIRSQLPDRVAALFAWDSGKNCYLAKGLTYNAVMDAIEADILDKSVDASSAAGLAVGGSSRFDVRPRPRWHA